MLIIDYNNPIIIQDMRTIDDSIDSVLLFGKSVYISGASGMIASYLIAYLIWLNEQKSAKIQIFAGIRNKEKAYKRFGEYIEKPFFHLVLKDVIFPLSVEKKIDYIIHAASLASPQFYGIYPVETMLPNIIGSYNLLEYSKANDVKSFLFLSSGAVYGTISDIAEINESSIGTFCFTSKGNEYGESKRSGEALSIAYWREYRVPIKIARIHHTYGPTVDINEDKRVFSEFVSNIIRRENIVLKSSGLSKRAFCYISDVISGLLKILLSEEDGAVYNIGNPDAYISIADLADCLVELFPDRELSVIRDIRNETGYCASPEEKYVPLCVDKLKKLGWKNQVGIKEGFKRTIAAIEYNNTK